MVSKIDGSLLSSLVQMSFPITRQPAPGAGCWVLGVAFPLPGFIIVIHFWMTEEEI